MRGVFLDLDSLAPEDLELQQLADCFSQFTSYSATSAEQTIERCRHADVVISNKVLLDQSVLNACPDLKLICVIATGTNNVDLAAAHARGITVCNCSAYGTDSVAQHTMALLLSLCSHLPDYQQAVASGRWSQSPQFCLLEQPLLQLSGKTLGVVGYGELGKAVVRLAEAFGMRILIAQRPGTPAQAADANRLPLAQLLPQVDVLTLHCPLTPATTNLIDAEQLALMKPGALLINTARGGIVNEQALAESLCRGHLAGAAMDVLSQEPPPQHHPLLADDIPNLLLTPHIAWTSQQARQALVDMTQQSIQSWLAGKPVNRV